MVHLFQNPGIIILFNLIGGTTMLIYGVNLMGEGLENANRRLIKKILSTIAGKVWSAFLVGTFFTALVQSSTAIMVMTVSLVNAGLIRLPQAVGIIYGANIGTTITAQLMSFEITEIALPALGVGFLLISLPKKEGIKSLGYAIMGLGFMFMGLKTLNASVPYIRSSQEIYLLFQKYGQNSLVGILVGIVTTALVHSSSATVGLTIILFNAHLITFEGAIGLTLGDNIGTCITAQIASLQGNKTAQRTAWAHTLYNIIGAAVTLTLLHPFSGIVHTITLSMGQNETRLVANSHTIFNILSAAIFLPLTKYYVRLIEWIIPD